MRMGQLETRHGRSNRSVAGLVLGAMGAMAILGLLFALLTVRARRDRDPKPEPASSQSEIRDQGSDTDFDP